MACWHSLVTGDMLHLVGLGFFVFEIGDLVGLLVRLDGLAARLLLQSL